MKKPILVGMTQQIPEVDSPCIVPSASKIRLEDATRIIQRGLSCRLGKDYVASVKRQVTHWDGTPTGVAILVLANVDTGRISRQEQQDVKSKLDEMVQNMDWVVDEIRNGGKRTQADALIKCRKLDEWIGEFRGLPVSAPAGLRLVSKAILAGLAFGSIFFIFFVMGPGKRDDPPRESQKMIEFLDCMSKAHVDDQNRANKDICWAMGTLRDFSNEVRRTSESEGFLSQLSRNPNWLSGIKPGVSDSVKDKKDQRDRAKKVLASAFLEDLGIEDFEAELRNRGVVEAGSGGNGMRYRPQALLTKKDFKNQVNLWLNNDRLNCSFCLGVIRMRTNLYSLATEIGSLTIEAKNSAGILQPLIKTESNGKLKLLQAVLEAAGKTRQLEQHSGPVLPFFADRDQQIVEIVETFFGASESWSLLTEKGIKEELMSAKSMVPYDSKKSRAVTSVYATLENVRKARQILGQSVMEVLTKEGASNFKVDAVTSEHSGQPQN